MGRALLGSADKVATLQTLGAGHSIHYTVTTEWLARAKELTGGHGFKHIVEVAGPMSVQQSLNAVAIAGTITIVSFMGGFGEDIPYWLQIITRPCTLRTSTQYARLRMRKHAINAAPQINSCIAPSHTTTLDLSSIHSQNQRFAGIPTYVTIDILLLGRLPEIPACRERKNISALSGSL